MAPFLPRPVAAQQMSGTVAGLHFGVETFSYHDLPPAGDPQLIPTIIRNMRANGIPECEIMSSVSLPQEGSEMSAGGLAHQKILETISAQDAENLLAFLHTL